MTQVAECKECGHVERSLTIELAFMKIATHLEEEHGITEDELLEDLENHLEEQ